MSTERKAENINPEGSFVKKMFFGQLAIVIVLVLMEVVLRFWIASPFHMVRDVELGLVGRPEARVVFSKEGYFRGRLNNLGLVDSEIGIGHQPTVLVVGDSYTEGLQVPMAHDFCSIAESLLTGTRVVNGGASGRSPVQDVLAAERLAPKVGASAIVLQVSAGDLESLFSEDQVHLERAEATNSEKWKIVVPSGYYRFTPEGRMKMKIISHSALVNAVWRRIELLCGRETRRLRRKWTRIPSTNGGDESKLFKEAAEGMDYLIGRLSRSSENLFLLYIPELQYLSSTRWIKREDRRSFWVNYARSRKLRLIDPTDALYQNYLKTGKVGHGFQNSVLGEGHLNSIGHAIVGECLEQVLQEGLSRRGQLGQWIQDEAGGNELQSLPASH